MLQVVLRTCDINSLQSNRVYPKQDVIRVCVSSLVDSLNQYKDYHLHIIDDNSSTETIQFLYNLSGNISIHMVTSKPDEYKVNPKLSSRYTVKLAYDYIYNLDDEHDVLVLEDDYLWELNSIIDMMTSYKKFQSWFSDIHIGIFPQDFNQLYYDPDNNPFNETYVQPCHVFPGIDRYYRTVWFTQESFLFPTIGFKKYKKLFDQLMLIGTEEGYWEGNTISQVWRDVDVMMLMPMRTLAVHISAERDISYYCYNWREKFESKG